MKLDNLAIGKSAVIVSVGGTGALRQHFLDRSNCGKICTNGGSH